MKHQYAQYVLDMFKPHGPMTAKALFGGYAFYCGGVIFAIIVEDQLYFKVDELTRADFESHDAQQFVYQGKSKTVAMPYMILPESILENRDELPVWIAKACEVSVRSGKKKPSKKKKILEK